MIYIIVENYPSNENRYALNFVHTRNLYYLENELEFKVVSFSAKVAYNFEGVNVINEKIFLKEVQQNNKINLLIHAPNIRNSLKLLKRLNNKISKQLIFFHGHEVMNVNKEYPEPYKFKKKSFFSYYLREWYDYFKFKIIKKYLNNNRENTKIIFVSKWMKNVFEKNINNPSNYDYEIINNPINSVFLDLTYEKKDELNAEFITIRKLDDSKYAIDIVCNIAEKLPEFNFHIYGKGEYFEHHELPSNVIIFDKFISQGDIPALLNRYKVALMPTRLDSQGVMACEIASFGMPLITSNIDVCSEMFSEFDNVLLINNNKVNIEEIKKFLNFKEVENINKIRFSKVNTIYKEISTIKEFIN